MDYDTAAPKRRNGTMRPMGQAYFRDGGGDARSVFRNSSRGDHRTARSLRTIGPRKRPRRQAAAEQFGSTPPKREGWIASS